MDKPIKKDALRDPVFFGKTYGYSMDRNGHLEVTIGKALKATKKGVTLEIISRSKALWDDDLAVADVEAGKKVNVKSGKLFPVKV